MMLIFLCFRRVLHLVLSNCFAESDRGCATFQRRMVALRRCATSVTTGTREANVSVFNHVHEKVHATNAVFGHLFRVVVISTCHC